MGKDVKMQRRSHSVKTPYKSINSTLELPLQETWLRFCRGKGMAVLKVKGSILKLVYNSPHSDWIPYAHLTTLSLLGLVA